MSGRFGLPGYVDLEPVGGGGYGQVFRARQPAFDRTVAIKILNRRTDDAATDRRFRRECQALGSLSGHPNIVPVHEAGRTPAGEPYLVMDYVRGGSLADSLGRSGPLPWPDVAAIGVKLAGALHSAHGAGILHRDIKPENVLLSDYGEPQLADFGIAQRTGHGTATEAAMTPSHTAPEQFAGAPASVVTDVYALASTLFTLLRGRPPFHGERDESVYALMARVATAPVPDLRSFGISDDLAGVIEQALDKDPLARPQSALAFGRRLQGVQSGSGLVVTALPLPREHDATGRPAPALDDLDEPLDPPGRPPTPDAQATVPVDPPPGTLSRPPSDIPSGTRPPAGPSRLRDARRGPGALIALVTVTIVVIVGLTLWLTVVPGLRSWLSHPTATAAGASPSDGTGPDGASAAPTSTGPVAVGAQGGDIDLTAGLLQPGSPSAAVAGVPWTALGAEGTARLARLVPVTCYDLAQDMAPAARTSLRVDRAGLGTALVQLVYRAAPDSTAKAMAGLASQTGCRLHGLTITRMTPTATPGLASMTSALGADAVALRVESSGETFYEVFLHRGEIVSALAWTGPYDAQRNWTIAVATARTALGRLPHL